MFSGEETVNRARSRLGEESYNLIFNNCEHFALWCKTGKSKSIQVEKAVTAAVVLGTIAIAALIIKATDQGAMIREPYAEIWHEDDFIFM